MATSDAPLNVPNVTLAVARGASAPDPDLGNAMFSDDFESYSDEQDLTATSAYGGVRFNADSAQSKNGSKSGRVSFVSGGFAGGFQVPFNRNLVEGDEVWIRGFVKWEAGWVWGTNLWKFMRVHTRSDAEANEGYIDWYVKEHSTDQFAFAYQNEVLGQNAYMEFGTPGSVDPDIGAFHAYEMYVYLHSTTPVLRMWRDNVLIFENTTEETLASSSSYADRFHLCTYYNNAAPQDQSMWLDDFEIYTSDSAPGNTDADGNKFIGGSL